MSDRSIQALVQLPLTGMRYFLSDKLLQIQNQERFQPASETQVEELVAVLEEAKINVNQLFNINLKTAELLGAIAEGKIVSEKIWDLIVSLRLIQAGKDTPVS
ncbi:MAG: hypothetical protein AAF570_13655, partial [Bacteroidota bacterium]